MATYSSFLAWRVRWTEEPGGLQSIGSQRVGHDWATQQQAQCNAVFLQVFFKLLSWDFSFSCSNLALPPQASCYLGISFPFPRLMAPFMDRRSLVCFLPRFTVAFPFSHPTSLVDLGHFWVLWFGASMWPPWLSAFLPGRKMPSLQDELRWGNGEGLGQWLAWCRGSKWQPVQS